MADPYKKKIEQDDDILEDGDFVLDGYTVNIEDTSKHNDDLSLDHNDYEHIQEEYTIRRRTTYCTRQIYRTHWKKPSII